MVIAIHLRNNYITNNIITHNELSFQKKNKWVKINFQLSRTKMNSEFRLFSQKITTKGHSAEPPILLYSVVNINSNLIFIVLMKIYNNIYSKNSH